MLYTTSTSETEGEVGPVKLFLIDRSRAVVLLWLYVAWFWCQRFGDVSPYVCLFYFSSVSVVEWPAAHSVDHMFS